MTETTQKRRIFVFSHPRTSSNLFVRLLENHPALGTKLYPFLYAQLVGPESSSRRTGNIKAPFIEEMKKEHSKATFQFQFEDLERAIGEIEAQGKIPVIKEHGHCTMYPHNLRNDPSLDGKKVAPIVDKFLDLPEADRRNTEAITTPSFPLPNPTFLPDRLFATFIPIINIRHPCRMIYSMKRALQFPGLIFPDDDSSVDTQFKWQRMVYECYKAWFATPEGIEAAGGASVAEQLPIIVDGDKLVNDPQGQMETVCRILNLDPSGIQYTWETREPESPGQAMFVGTLNRSTGVIKGKDGSDKIPALEEEVKKWSENWGEKTAEEMKILVEQTMDDYKYLLERSI